MEQDRRNTPENVLGPGIGDDELREAVQKSGYPLQTVIANALSAERFWVQEEWGYIDEQSGDLRALDIWASKRLYELSRGGEQPLVRPTLDLLIECKQSNLPYVFFNSATRPILSHFPYFAGLAQYEIRVSTDDSQSSWTFSMMRALDLQAHPFVRDDVELCTLIARCARKGKTIELTGTDAYQNIVLPLVKALRYFEKQQKPPKTARYFDCHVPLAIAVIDAPMISTRSQDALCSLRLTPWVRVIRNEAVESEDRSERIQTLAVDVVHRSFFRTYLREHVMSFATEFSQRALRHHEEVATGRGFAAGLQTNHMSIETRLVPHREPPRRRKLELEFDDEPNN